jgi:hypothetical protein
VGELVLELGQLLFFRGWVRGCARIFGVHSLPPSLLWAGSREVVLRGAIILPTS